MTSAVADTLKSVSSEWMGHYRAKRFKELSEMYTEDCKVYAPGRPISVGRAECAAVWKSLSDMGVAEIVLGNLEVEYDGCNMAADRSTFKLVTSTGAEIDHGEYVVIWRRAVDRKNPSKGPYWQFHYEIFNSNVPSVKSARTYVVEQSNKWEHFYATGEMESLAGLYTPDCKLFPPGRPVADGRIACARAWGRMREAGSRYVKIDNVETLEMGDGLASDYSKYKITDARGKQIDHGKFVVIWKQLGDGQWYLHYNIFNSDVN